MVIAPPEPTDEMLVKIAGTMVAVLLSHRVIPAGYPAQGTKEDIKQYALVNYGEMAGFVYKELLAAAPPAYKDARKDPPKPGVKVEIYIKQFGWITGSRHRKYKDMWEFGVPLDNFSIEHNPHYRHQTPAPEVG